MLPPTCSRIFSQLSVLRASAPVWMLVSWKALGTRWSSSVYYFWLLLKLASILNLPLLIVSFCCCGGAEDSIELLLFR